MNAKEEIIQILKELLDEFRWCATSIGISAPLAEDIVKDIAKKHIELIMPFLEVIDCEFYTTNVNQDLYNAILLEIDNL